MKAFAAALICIGLMIAVIWWTDKDIAPLFLNSRVERLPEQHLPKISIEKGTTVYCRMKADDFRFPLPPGSHATNLVVSGGFDTVHGSVEVRFGGVDHFTASQYQDWLSGKIQQGGQVIVETISNGLLIKFHYFGDK